jgi:aldose sugar dehydrogenase
MARLAGATALSVLLGAGTLACAQSGAEPGEPVQQGAANVPEFPPAFEGQTRAPAVQSDVTLEVQTLTEGLSHPWGIAVLPDGATLVTEREGRLRVFRDGELVPDPVSGLPEVLAQKQGGLLDVAVGPGFAEDRLIYWTYAKPMGDGMSATAAARGRLSEDMAEVTQVEDIFVQEPPSPTPQHYGSRILFDAEGHAYVSTGEHFTEEERQYAQDLDKTYGKVVRIDPDGSVPEGNPFADREGALASIWTYGHRNIQGAAFHPETGALWVAEHGPQGGDELNLIEPGANYGWPVISYGENYNGSPIGEGVSDREGMEQPRYYWDPVIAPGGMTFYDGDMIPQWQGNLLVSSLTPGALVRLELDGDTVTGEERLLTDQGRVRDVEVAPDGSILVITDRDDGALLQLVPEQGS